MSPMRMLRSAKIEKTADVIGRQLLQAHAHAHHADGPAQHRQRGEVNAHSGQGHHQAHNVSKAFSPLLMALRKGTTHTAGGVAQQFMASRPTKSTA